MPAAINNNLALTGSDSLPPPLEYSGEDSMVLCQPSYGAACRLQHKANVVLRRASYSRSGANHLGSSGQVAPAGTGVGCLLEAPHFGSVASEKERPEAADMEFCGQAGKPFVSEIDASTKMH